MYSHILLDKNNNYIGYNIGEYVANIDNYLVGNKITNGIFTVAEIKYLVTNKNSVRNGYLVCYDNKSQIIYNIVLPDKFENVKFGSNFVYWVNNESPYCGKRLIIFSTDDNEINIHVTPNDDAIQESLAMQFEKAKTMQELTEYNNQALSKLGINNKSYKL